MSVLVKICGMTDGAGIEAAVAAGADALGFVFYAPSPRNLAPERAADLAALVPAHISRVAVMLHPKADEWLDVQRVMRPDVLQTDLDDFAYLDVEHGIEKWPVVREGAVPQALPPTFVYEGSESGKGQTVDWQGAAKLARQGKLVLAGGLTAANVAKAISEVRPYGVDVSSAVESAPGVKDAAKIRAFIEAAKA
jgi:phosphoribosylanthranilate isomerase